MKAPYLRKSLRAKNIYNLENNSGRGEMVKLTLKISFISILLILFSFQSSISLEKKNQDKPHKVMKTQEISKSLKVSPDYGKIPLYFIPNEGQVHDKALFYAKASRYTLW